MRDPDLAVRARGGRPSVEMLGAISLICTGWFLASVVVLHVINPALNPIGDQMSEYALGPTGWVMTVAFLAVGAGIVALGLGLRRSLTAGPRVWAASLVTVVGVSFVGLAVFPTDALLADGTTVGTFSGQMHVLISFVGALFLLVGAFVLRGVFARDPSWHPLARVTGWFAVAMVLWFLIGATVNVAFRPGSYSGGVQRVFWVVQLGWLSLMGARLWRLGAASTAASRPVDSSAHAPVR